jgi:PAS domain S-box-containing protein
VLEKEQFLEGGGRMGEAIGRLGASSSLGPPAGWPNCLKLHVSSMLHLAQPAFIAWGTDRTVLYNDAYVPLLGAKHPGALASPYFEVWGEIAQVMRPSVDRVLAGGRVGITDIAVGLTGRGGPEIGHFEFTFSPLRDENWCIAGFLCICRETTDAVREKARSDRENTRLARMFDRSPSFIALLEGPEHRLVMANARFRQLTGHAPIAGRPLADALPGAVDRGCIRLLDQAYADGRTSSLRGAVFEIQPAGGPVTSCHIDFIFQPLMSEAGVVTGIFVEGSDVTERVRAEATLESKVNERTAQVTARENLIRMFFQHSSECHAVLEEVAEGVFRYQEINPATLQLYGRTRDEIIGRTVDEVFDADTANTLNGHLSQAMRSGQPYQYERVHGDSVVEALAAPISPELGLGRRLVVSARDVSERRRLEQHLRQAQKMDAIGNLTGGIAHDFNNLLTGITGTLELIQSRISQGRYAELDRYIASGQGAARRAAALTHRLLAFARRQTLDAKPTEVNRLVTDMVDLIQRTVGPEIKVEVVGAVGLWRTLVDANQLENALLNLCINARDAMPGGGTITIETANRWIDDRMARECELQRGQYISVCVSDTGCGMTPDVAAKAFDPFFTTKPIGQGTGLGLSMIYGFAQQSGGQARIYSEPGRGTTVCVYLPRFAGLEPPLEDPADGALSAMAADGETVLVVDDEATVRMLATEVLSDLGYVSVEAPDGVSALKILQSKQRVDLLITDVGLPNGLNGRQLADAARALRAGLKVLFITGYAENAVFGHGHLPEGCEVLSKPFTMEVLANRVTDMIKPPS